MNPLFSTFNDNLIKNFEEGEKGSHKENDRNLAKNLREYYKKEIANKATSEEPSKFVSKFENSENSYQHLKQYVEGTKPESQSIPWNSGKRVFKEKNASILY